jgi:hypothetical protein
MTEGTFLFLRFCFNPLHHGCGFWVDPYQIPHENFDLDLPWVGYRLKSFLTKKQTATVCHYLSVNTNGMEITCICGQFDKIVKMTTFSLQNVVGLASSYMPSISSNYIWKCFLFRYMYNYVINSKAGLASTEVYTFF